MTTQAVSTPEASAASTVTLRVVIEHVQERGCTDNLSGSDFYARTTIDGTTTNFDEIDGEDEISPNWTAEKAIDVDAKSSVPVKIELAESDGFLNFGDDDCDIDPNNGDKGLDLTVNLIPCSVSGDKSGVCAMPITTIGNGDGDGNAELRFRVEVDVPAATPGLAVRCTHSPLWPQPGDNVTITAESLDGTVQVGDTMPDLSNGPPAPPLVNHTKIADDLEIWVNETNAPDLHVQNKTTDSFVVNNAAAGDLVYGCVVKQGTDKVFTGWRRVRVGAPAEGKAIPVSYTGDRTHRVDVVFIPDMDDYNAVNDPNFLSDVSDVIKGSYYGQDYFLANQQRMNFWLADQRGDTDRVAAPTPTDPTATRCVLTVPSNWSTDYSWRDTGAILHRANFRDCANHGVFSTEPTSLGTVLHESGHAPFGLADEYCCDGGYFKASPWPDLYDTLAECQADAPNLNRTAVACRTFTDTRPTPNKDWFTSEPQPNDLMNADRHPPQAADIRRMNWFFGNCKDGKC
ncbi:MAG: hypothetical protein ACRDS0_14955 [Pseudonocardiaceae bacterium]